MLESHGASRILASFHDIVPNWIFAGLYFSDKYLAKHPDIVRRVLTGFVKSFEFISTHEKEARRFLPKYTKVEEDLCMKAALREYAPIEPLEHIHHQRDLMVKYGYIKKAISVDAMIDYSYIPKELKQPAKELKGGAS
jgi:ABC-type nitrate/sulfonate/bicarbonate transport system substrate-binding protein